MAGPMERIQVLDNIEKDIIACLSSAFSHECINTEMLKEVRQLCMETRQEMSDLRKELSDLKASINGCNSRIDSLQQRVDNIEKEFSERLILEISTWENALLEVQEELHQEMQKKLECDVEILNIPEVTAQVLFELSKEKSSQKAAETNTSAFLRTLSSVEVSLGEQINYLQQGSTGQPHEGSGYASQKVLQMAWHRLEHVRSWVNELDRLRAAHLAAPHTSTSTSTAPPPRTAPTSNGNVGPTGT